MTEPEKVHERVALSIFLMVLATGAWLLFATKFAEDLTTYCGPDCISQTVHITTWDLLWLGVAVALTVFSAATAVLAGMASLHNKQLEILTRSSA